ncbi:MAG: hypothetical protein KU37_07540 [Sulfuricurvum sp. PC08-66]|nr:MAG: hypothetical protein KU37_07540 [Sulfuricurvum sp. PC08-66]
MIRNVSSAQAGAIFNNSGGGKAKEATTSKQEPSQTSRVEELKAAIQKGEYKIDLDATAKKMAEALL